jgi:hypothetical protein
VDFAITLAVALCAIFAILLATRRFGRLAGFSTAAAFGVTMAYFTMPPSFSFAVENPLDQGALVVYSMASLFLVQKAPRRRKSAALPRLGSGYTGAVGALVADTIAEALLAGGHEPVAISVDRGLGVSRPAGEALELFGAVVDAAYSAVTPLAMSVYAGLTPGQERVWVAFQYGPAPEWASVATIGRHVDGCTPLVAAGLGDCAVSWFDNGYERIYQICLPVRTGLRADAVAA